MSRKVQKVLEQPILFKFYTSREEVEFWLFETPQTRIRGKIMGFDEYMNIVIDQAKEIYMKDKSEKQIGRIMLKGENITLIRLVQVAQ